MVTAKQVYDIALVLIDEVLENGSIIADQPNYYEAKAKSILTLLQAELSLDASIIVDLSQELAVDDNTAMSVLPYGLAAHLLVQEDPNTASYFNNRYDELKRKRKTSSVPIIDKNNVLGGMQ